MGEAGMFREAVKRCNLTNLGFVGHDFHEAIISMGITIYKNVWTVS